MANSIGVIGGKALESYLFSSGLNVKQSEVKKVFIGDWNSSNSVQIQFPSAEIVQDVHSILQDSTIDTVIVSGEELKIAGEAMNAGKSVRIIW